MDCTQLLISAQYCGRGWIEVEVDCLLNQSSLSGNVLLGTGQIIF